MPDNPTPELVIVCEDCDFAVSVEYADALITCNGNGGHLIRYPADEDPDEEWSP